MGVVEYKDNIIPYELKRAKKEDINYIFFIIIS